jgi:hypothetical protein
MGPKRKLTSEQERDIVGRYLVDKQTVNAISEALAIPRITVQRTLARNNIAPRAELAKPRVYYARKTGAVEACLNGLTVDEAARKFGMSSKTVARALREHGVVLPKGARPTCTLDHHAFDEITPASAYWMGFLFADGAVGDDGYGAPWVATHLAERDRGHVEKFRDFLGSNHAITRTVTEQRFGGPAVYFKVRSRRLVDALGKAGMCPGKEKREPCEELVASRDFWRGAVDGDGTIGQYGTYPTFHMCGSEALLTCLQHFLCVHDLGGLRQTRTQSGIYRVQTCSRKATRIIRLLYENATIGLDRKLERAKAILSGQVQDRTSP